MADTAILAAGGANAPLTYKVPGVVAIRIKQIHVAYADNGAGVDWLPMVRIVSDSNHTVGQASDQGVKVTAGNDAAVTFSPGVKHAATTGTTATNVFARAIRDALGAFGDPSQQVNAGATNNGSFPHTSTTDATVIKWRTSVLTNDTADLFSTGTYLVWATTHWDAIDASLTTTIMDAAATGFPHTADLPTGNPAFGDAVGSAQSQDYNTLHVTAPPISIHVAHGNATGGNRFVNQCYFSVLYIPTA